MPRDTTIRSVLIIGSGPIVIGQACEFDYAGSQAARSLREEGVEVILINSNPATIMTDPVTADYVYLLPLEKQSIIQILETHRVDAVLPTMGGQTALNLAMDCEKAGVWKRHGVRVIGVDFEAIETTEDREKFRRKMIELGVGVCQGATARSFLEGKEIAQRIGFPLVIRPSYTLGGTGGGFVNTPEEFDNALQRGLHASPIHEVLVEQSILGWKEFELELLRDADRNIIIICSIENFDPMGIHTGDSITVAPAMTLPDTVYQRMRDLAIRMMNGIGQFAGGCNVQFSLNPLDDEDIIAIEINPRVSRSSALASKATGYPIAKIAAKLALGYRLDELKNAITKTTSAFFEPALDYVIVKIPRWNFDKFKGADRRLGLQMKSVGEVMGIGKSFQEALQKACQSLEIKRNGLGADGRELTDQARIIESLANPSWNRLFHIYDGIKLGIPLKRIQELTKIDLWFLKQIEELILLEKEIQRHTVESLPAGLLLEAKRRGYADRQIAHLVRCLESQIYKRRTDLGIERVYKQVDTCAAEFEAGTPYYYSTFSPTPQPPPLQGGGAGASSQHHKGGREQPHPPTPSPTGRGSIASVDERPYGFAYQANPSAYPDLKDHAREMRLAPTFEEGLLWKRLSNKQLGVKFRRQHPVWNFIADFACVEKAIIIELDGSQHDEQENKQYDKARDEELTVRGYQVLRFLNHEVRNNIDSVIHQIKNTIAYSAQNPLPVGEGGGGAIEGRGAGGEGSKERQAFSSLDISSNESLRTSKPKIIVLGSGPNRIGQGIEFDYSCVHGVLAARECGFETIMINCNPETVSTDFDIADKLYFEPVFWEHIYDIIRHEQPVGVIVQLGGQTALKLAEKLDRYGIPILGTSYKSLDLAEDRGAFSTLLRDLGIPYPRFTTVTSADHAIETSRELGFPLLVRPSYVLGGQSMKIVINERELEEHVVNILADMPENNILVDQFLENALEAEADAICDGEDCYIIGVMEHIEPAGIHSGDSYAVLPAFHLSDDELRQIREHTTRIALAMQTKGLINIQFAIKEGIVYVIEANPRASRTVPFICKAYGEPYVNWATRIMLGESKVRDFKPNPRLTGYAIKIPVFSFDKFPDVNKELGPEMKSTGEAIRFIPDLHDDFFLRIYAERNLYLSR